MGVGAAHEMGQESAEVAANEAPQTTTMLKPPLPEKMQHIVPSGITLPLPSQALPSELAVQVLVMVIDTCPVVLVLIFDNFNDCSMLFVVYFLDVKG